MKIKMLLIGILLLSGLSCSNKAEKSDAGLRTSKAILTWKPQQKLLNNEVKNLKMR